MKKIWYAIVETMEVPDDATDQDIDDILMVLATNNGTLDETGGTNAQPPFPMVAFRLADGGVIFANDEDRKEHV